MAGSNLKNTFRAQSASRDLNSECTSTGGELAGNLRTAKIPASPASGDCVDLAIEVLMSCCGAGYFPGAAWQDADTLFTD